MRCWRRACHRRRTPHAPELQFRYALGRAPTQQGACARFELAQRERLHQVVVGAEIERAHALLEFFARRRDQYGHRVGTCAQATQQFDAVHVGQTEIEHDEVVGVVAQGGIGLASAGETIDRVAGLGERRADRVGDRGVVLDDQDAHRRILASASAVTRCQKRSGTWLSNRVENDSHL